MEGPKEDDERARQPQLPGFLQLPAATMRLTRRQMLQAAAASAGFLSMPAVVTRAFAAESVPLRGGEILPDPDFSRLPRTVPYLVGIPPHHPGGVCLKPAHQAIA